MTSMLLLFTFFARACVLENALNKMAALTNQRARKLSDILTAWASIYFTNYSGC